MEPCDSCTIFNCVFLFLVLLYCTVLNRDSSWVVKSQGVLDPVNSWDSHVCIYIAGESYYSFFVICVHLSLLFSKMIEFELHSILNDIFDAYFEVVFVESVFSIRFLYGQWWRQLSESGHYHY